MEGRAGLRESNSDPGVGRKSPQIDLFFYLVRVRDEDDWFVLPASYQHIHELIKSNPKFYREFLRAIEHGKPKPIQNKKRNDPAEVQLQQKAALRSAFHRIWGFQFSLPPFLVANKIEILKFISRPRHQTGVYRADWDSHYLKNGGPFAYQRGYGARRGRGRNRACLHTTGACLNPAAAVDSMMGADGQRLGGRRLCDFGNEDLDWLTGLPQEFGGEGQVEKAWKEFHMEADNHEAPYMNGTGAASSYDMAMEPSAAASVPTRMHIQESRSPSGPDAPPTAAPSVQAEDASPDVLVKIYDLGGAKKTYMVKHGRVFPKAFSKVARVYADNFQVDPSDISFRVGGRDGAVVDLMNFGGTSKRELILYAVVHGRGPAESSRADVAESDLDEMDLDEDEEDSETNSVADLARLFPLSFTAEEGSGTEGDRKNLTAAMPPSHTPQTQGTSANKGKTKLSNFFDVPVEGVPEGENRDSPAAGGGNGSAPEFSDGFVAPQMDDRRLEVMAFDSACHGVMTLSGLAKAKPFMQSNSKMEVEEDEEDSEMEAKEEEDEEEVT
uniref:Uncharacterized protein n=1 Tax=Chromera velia CCMP2878 TaxID=1169474 RepID=A0A0G4HB38_9ALVE|eukprot:Cvel_25865.t1-p1 / transcript=Cvel_25865.t1 / gene=Cvel_25865 / organism=Chromera_velia_CCMP2878 / gene_product=hypothetical protein / transcript_product=hypothetical protein / location=Cvel_scaffold2983:6832-15702(-) / protein_length=553 / sequence_SO=supercontig / SO=protein_coding / is_pseudo=false